MFCHLLAECVGNATSWSIVGQKPVLQVNSGLSDEIISRGAIIVHDPDDQFVLNGEFGRNLKHLSKEWVEVVGYVILLVTNFLLSNSDLQVRVRLQGEWQKRGGRERGGRERDRERGKRETETKGQKRERVEKTNS